MTEEFSSVDRLINAPVPGRVNPAGESNPDKKQGFAKTLKKKMEKKKKDEDGYEPSELLQEDDADTVEPDDDPEQKPDPAEHSEKSADTRSGPPSDHIDLKA